MNATGEDQLADERAQGFKNRVQLEWHQVNESVQRLAFYVIGLEAVLCGYLLLYADRLSGIRLAPYLFLASGLAAICGLLWRYYYNETWFQSANGQKLHPATTAWQMFFYRAFLRLSVAVFVAVLISGFIYLREQSSGVVPQSSSAAPKEP